MRHSHTTSTIQSIPHPWYGFIHGHPFTNIVNLKGTSLWSMVHESDLHVSTNLSTRNRIDIAEFLRTLNVDTYRELIFIRPIDDSPTECRLLLEHILIPLKHISVPKYILDEVRVIKSMIGN